MSPAHVQLTFACSRDTKGSYTDFASDSASKMIKLLTTRIWKDCILFINFVYIVFYHVLKLLHNFTIKFLC